mmetsp:Transcript_79533/g.165158  ORF Transcript_79533/g.165158 Transcript_79533/m.165158 type:complete len:329 (-) Transcript_79533:608-1594(-)
MALFVWDVARIECRRRSTMCLTLAVLLPLKSRINSINSVKPNGLSSGSPLSLFSENIVSAISMIPKTSTPVSSRTRQASGFCTIFKNSSLEMRPPSLLPINVKRSLILSFTKLMAKASFSVAATALTTSHKTPMSMFMTVIADIKTKSQNSIARAGLSCPTARTRGPRLSMKVPSMSNVYIDLTTLLKYLSPTAVESVNCRKAMPKTYSTIMRRQSVKKTERVAAAIPLRRMSNSGMARKSRTIRAIRESRSKRAILRIDAFPMEPEAPWPTTSISPDISQPSKTIIKTRQESNTNQASFKHCRLRLKDKNRTVHSKLKKTMKECSTT